MNYPLTQSVYYKTSNLLQEQNFNTQSQFRSDLTMCQSTYLEPQYYKIKNKNPFYRQVYVNKKVPFEFRQEDQVLHREQLQTEKLAAEKGIPLSFDQTEAFKAFNEIENDSEDEGIEDYIVGGYHPVHVGEVLQNRYLLIQKLGWGHFSTVWLSRDFKYDTFVAVKVQKSAEHYIEAAYDEVEVLQKVAANAGDADWISLLKGYLPQKTSFDRDDCHVVQLLNSFVHKGPYGNHFCMVFEILGVNLLEIIKRYEFKGIPLNICKRIAKQTLIGLDYLHTVCGVIHTDLKPENVLVQLSQEEIKEIIENGQLNRNQVYQQRLEVFHKALNKYDPPMETLVEPLVEPIKQQQKELKTLTKTQKKNHKRRQQKKKQNQEVSDNQNQENKDQNDKQDTVEKVQTQNTRFNQITQEPDLKSIFQLNKEKYLRFNTFFCRISFKSKTVLPSEFQIKIADLGNACWTHHHFSTLIQTRQYRSPETIIGVSYNQSADLWSFACMLFELVTGDFLFEPRKGGHFSKNDDHLAQMQELMGRFPLKFTQGSLKAKRYFNRDGSLKRIPALNCWSLENVLIEKYRFKLSEAKELASFFEPMLNPYPHKRVAAGVCLKHPWLCVQGDDSFNGRMTEEEMKSWQSTKDMLIQDDLYKPHLRSKFYESEEDNGDSSIEAPSLKRYGPWRAQRPSKITALKVIKPRTTEMCLVDRSFTDLGYIGFESGIDTRVLDLKGNQQFNR